MMLDRNPSVSTATSYQIDFACNDADPLQQRLNELYQYGKDLNTKILHRSRLNLFSLLLHDIAARGEIASFGSAIDIGCNAGMYSRMLSDCGFRYVLGIDIVPEMVGTARRAFEQRAPGRVVEFILQNAESLDTARKFDFVLCTEVIEHTNDPGRVISNIKAVMTPKGTAIISLPNRMSLPYVISRLAHRIGRRPSDEDFEKHLAYPFYRSIRLFHGEGTEVIATDGTNLFWNTLALRWLHRTAWFPALNRLNFRLARLWPLKYAAQFFYLIVRRT